MTQKSVPSGNSPQVTIRSGGDVWIRGQEGDRVLAETRDRLGLKVKRRDGVVEVEMGGSGQVWIPFGSNVKVYCAQSAQIMEIHGTVSAVAGHNLHIGQVHAVSQASAGKALDLDCHTVEGTGITFTAGQDLRCWIKELRSAHYCIDDLGGKRETTVGDGSVQLRLQAGGDVTLIIDPWDMIPQPPAK